MFRVDRVVHRWVVRVLGWVGWYIGGLYGGPEVHSRFPFLVSTFALIRAPNFSPPRPRGGATLNL